MARAQTTEAVDLALTVEEAEVISGLCMSLVWSEQDSVQDRVLESVWNALDSAGIEDEKYTDTFVYPS